MTKQCTKCKRDLDEKEFYFRSNKTGLRSECKACSRTQKICSCCGKKHNSHEVKTSSHICPDCYPFWRQAYNLHAICKYRAKKRGLDFDLEVLDIYRKLLIPCPKTGLHFELGKGNHMGNRSPRCPSIDKIDPTKGYTKDNIQVVCWWYNVSKQQFSDLEVLELCKAVLTTYEMSHAQNVENVGKTDMAIT